MAAVPRAGDACEAKDRTWPARGRRALLARTTRRWGGALALASLALAGCGDEGSPEGALAGASGASGGGAAAEGAGWVSVGGAPPVLECIPREGCQRLCAALGADPAGCGFGDLGQCGCLCEERFNAPCPLELAALSACAGDAPSLDCSTRGRVFAGCERESFALEECDFRARGELCAEQAPACGAYCRAAVLAACPVGPESLASCLCGCELSLATRCAGPLEAYASCTSGAPALSCDAEGRPVASSCLGEWQALAACAALPSSQ